MYGTIKTEDIGCLNDLYMMIKTSTSIKENIRLSVYEADKLSIYGYSEIVELMSLRYKALNIKKDIKKLRIGYSLNQDDVMKHVEKKYKITDIKLYPEFFEMLEIYKEFPDLGKKKKNILMVNDHYGMSMYASKCKKYLNRRNKFKSIINSNDTIQLNIMTTLQETSKLPDFMIESTLIDSKEIFDKEIIELNRTKDGYDFIVIQNYLSAQIDAASETNNILSLMSKINTCINLQKLEGNAIIKINTFYTKPTIRLIKLISFCYESVSIFRSKYTAIDCNESYLILERFKVDRKKEVGVLSSIYNYLNEIIFNLQNTDIDNKKVIDLFENLPIDHEMISIISKQNLNLNHMMIDMFANNIQFTQNKDSSVLNVDKDKKKIGTKWYLKNAI